MITCIETDKSGSVVQGQKHIKIHENWMDIVDRDSRYVWDMDVSKPYPVDQSIVIEACVDGARCRKAKRYWDTYFA